MKRFKFTIASSLETGDLHVIARGANKDYPWNFLISRAAFEVGANCRCGKCHNCEIYELYEMYRRVNPIATLR
jgi:hypothetical protein